MNKAEYTSLTQGRSGRIQLKAADLGNQDARTLIYGYNCNRDTFHLYVDDAGLQLVIYDFDGLLLRAVHERDGLTPEHCVPDKRVYPAACDFEFCKSLALMGVEVPFTSWDEASDGRNAKKLSQLVTTYKREDLLFQFGGDLTGLKLESSTESTLVREVIEGQLHGALRATLLRGSADGAKAAQWISNIPESVQHSVHNHRSMHWNTEFSLSLEAGEALKQAATAAYEGRLKLLTTP